MQRITFKWTETATREATVVLPDDMTPEEVSRELVRRTMQGVLGVDGTITTAPTVVSRDDLPETFGEEG